MSFLESLVLSITMAADAMCAGASDGKLVMESKNIKLGFQSAL